jgi:molybdopterin-guanine dinucleotide biosynthesis protein
VYEMFWESKTDFNCFEDLELSMYEFIFVEGFKDEL